ncbi:MAG: RodZ domain-containing protein [Bryobacteraceae bacterium]
MALIGERLRKGRQQKGLTLEELANQTKIGARLLSAIEAEEYDKLPGGVFRKSFVRQYARAIGLDEEEIARDFEAQHPTVEVPLPAVPEDPVVRHLPAVIEGGRTWKLQASVSSFAAVVAVMLLCSIIYAWWQRSGEPQAQQLSDMATVAAPPRVDAAPVPSSQPMVLDTAEANRDAPPAPEALATPVQIGFAATEPTWLAVTADGQRVFTDTLSALQTKALGASETMRVVIGNAGGVEITVNGQPVGKLGESGDVRVIEVSRDGYRIVRGSSPAADSGDPLF